MVQAASKSLDTIPSNRIVFQRDVLAYGDRLIQVRHAPFHDRILVLLVLTASNTRKGSSQPTNSVPPTPSSSKPHQDTLQKRSIPVSNTSA